MYNLNLRKRRRGQIRAIDFIVSLLLFLLMLSQLILVVINVQSGLNSQMRQDLTYEELDTFGRLILQEEGLEYWGYQQSLTDTFGLAVSEATSSLNLDAAKISRIITGTTFPTEFISGFEQFDYPSVKSILGLDSKQDFQLSLHPYLELSIEISEPSTSTFESSIQVTDTQSSLPIRECHVNFFTLDLTTGFIRFEGIEITDDNGRASLEYNDPHFNNPDGEHISIAVAEKGPLWGMTWGHPEDIHENVFLGQDSHATIWIGGINTSSILVSDRHEFQDTPETHFLSYIYKNTQGSYTNGSIIQPSLFEGNQSIKIPNEGPTFFFSIVKVNDVFKVGIGTYPAILDTDLSSGNFYQVFGKISEGTREFTKSSKTYPVYIRGTVMRCRLILWRSR
ncbi:MAG: hypothetical protein ACW98I_11045 [Candidatus Hodarchaeales archaeon]|jgi:hypothetical protein